MPISEQHRAGSAFSADISVHARRPKHTNRELTTARVMKHAAGRAPFGHFRVPHSAAGGGSRLLTPGGDDSDYEPEAGGDARHAVADWAAAPAAGGISVPFHGAPGAPHIRYVGSNVVRNASGAAADAPLVHSDNCDVEVTAGDAHPCQVFIACDGLRAKTGTPTGANAQQPRHVLLGLSGGAKERAVAEHVARLAHAAPSPPQQQAGGAADAGGVGARTGSVTAMDNALVVGQLAPVAGVDLSRARAIRWPYTVATAADYTCADTDAFVFCDPQPPDTRQTVRVPDAGAARDGALLHVVLSPSGGAARSDAPLAVVEWAGGGASQTLRHDGDSVALMWTRNAWRVVARSTRGGVADSHFGGGAAAPRKRGAPPAGDAAAAATAPPPKKVTNISAMFNVKPAGAAPDYLIPELLI